MSQAQFVNFRVHTEFSIQFGMIRIEELIAKLSDPAIAISDHMNLFAVVKFYNETLAKGIKPIIACEINLQLDAENSRVYSAILVCLNQTGYRHLTQLISKAYEQGQVHGKPRIYWEWLAEFNEGLVAISGAQHGDIGQALIDEKFELGLTYAKRWQNVFSNRFYLEVSRVGHPLEAKYQQEVTKISEILQLPIIATNAVCFLNEEDYDAHEARICIQQARILADPGRPRNYYPNQYLKSADEMLSLFSDMPFALENSVELAKRCNLELHFGKSYLPNFPTPDNMSVDEYLRTHAGDGLKRRFLQLGAHIDKNVYLERLQTELDVIVNMGFPGYFLIVADFIDWAKKNDVPVGPGRGSGAGSLVAYALGITNIDPLQYDLLFERFLNPERVSMPDFDVDFCMVGRDKVIDYVASQYGRDSVAQIITFGTMAAKAVVRDVGRVLGFPYGFVDKIAKLIPFEIGMTLANALSQEPELLKRYQEEDDVKELLNLAQKLEGLTRNAGKHAGGVVIAPSKLTDFTAVYCEENSTQKVSQFDKDDVEAVGLVKFDFLGLRTLTIIKDALSMVSSLESGLSIDISHIPLDDKATYDLLQSGHTTAIFQLESRGMQELIKRLKPDCFEDIIALVALFRPGPLQSGMVDDFIDRKQGRAPIFYLHPDLEPILKPTYGVILYQEQVMQIAQVLASYTLGAADLLRRAMGKKKPEEMAKQRSIFLEGASTRGVDANIASQIFDLMEKFAGYGFNKSHSAAYALVSYQTAWLKCHYPSAFMAAVLSSDMDNTDKVVHMLEECKRMKLKVLKPSVHHDVYAFKVLDLHEIQYGLGAIKGIGEAAVDLIAIEREKHGPYLSLKEMCKRLDLRKINKRVFEALIKSGALDEIGVTRATLWHELESAMKLGAQSWQNQQLGQQDLWTLFEEDTEHTIVLPEWPLNNLLAAEKETLGWYTSGHPADEFADEFKSLCDPFNVQAFMGKKMVRLCGMIAEWRKMITKKGKPIIILSLAQEVGTIEMIALPDKLPETISSLGVGDLIFVEAEVGFDQVRQQVRLMAQKILRPDELRAQYASRLNIVMNENNEFHLEQLKTVLKLHPGNCPVRVNYHHQQFKVSLKLGDEWRVEPSKKLEQALELLLESAVDFHYGHQLT